jgi:hypothetical protein
MIAGTNSGAIAAAALALPETAGTFLTKLATSLTH